MKTHFFSQILGIALAFWTVNLAWADVVPNYLAGVEGDGTYALSDTFNTRTYQMTIDAAQLSGMISHKVSGIQWRLNGPATPNWPSVNTSYISFDVFIGAGADPSTMSNTFANNFSGPVTQVRSGSFTFLANSFSGGNSPNAFGVALNFDTGYLYNGGDLAIELRFSQQSGAVNNQPFFDGVSAFGGPGNGWGVDFSARHAFSSTANVGNPANFLVTNLISQPVPEPSPFTFIGLGLSAIISRRKRNWIA